MLQSFPQNEITWNGAVFQSLSAIEFSSGSCSDYSLTALPSSYVTKVCETFCTLLNDFICYLYFIEFLLVYQL